MKKVLVVGIAKSGISTLKILKELGFSLTINDIKTDESLKEILLSINGLYDEKILGRHPNLSEIKDCGTMILSPGVPTDLEFIVKAKENNIDVIGEIELAYRLSLSKHFIGITGTNGKTTTTALVGEIFENAHKKAYVVGNIGVPAISVALSCKKDDYLITELSSFQLESISSFSAHIAAILNITPDHLNRHKTMKNYIDAKSNVFLNQSKNDILVLNYDNLITRKIALNVSSNVKFFSLKEKVNDGVFLDGNIIVIKSKGKTMHVMDKNDIFILGEHNLENAMAAILISYYSGIGLDVIRYTLKTFKGVEHRIEFVDKINGVSYYNDSKGTNPDASIKAIQAMKGKTFLIAGGMDKKSEFDDFIKSFDDKVKELILFGETKNIIALAAKKNEFTNYIIVDTLKEAIEESFKKASKGENVLLSPACASWDMYKSYEHRGKEFKEIVSNLRG